MDNAMVSLIIISWIEVYPVDSAIQCLNNWSLKMCHKICFVLFSTEDRDHLIV